MPTATGLLKAVEFVHFCEDLAMTSLGPSFPRPERKAMWTILQLHYGNPDAHFELQPQVSHGRVELGLHFEGPVEQNDLYTLALAERACELMAELGPGWELEEWTSTWRRLHRVFPIARLDVALGREVAAELAKALRMLQPFAAACAESYVPRVAMPGPSREGRERHWRRTKRTGQAGG
jgi:hypothetical protein